MYGTPYADVLVGNGTPNGMDGGPGNDVLVGRGHRDYLFGRHGDDQLDGGTGGDYLLGGEGRDSLFGRAGNDNLNETQQLTPNLILAGAGWDKCYGRYPVPPNVERGCESHNPPPYPPLRSQLAHTLQVYGLDAPSW